MSRWQSLFALGSALLVAGCPDDPKRPLGATCTDSEQCESGLCLDGICVDPAFIGDADAADSTDATDGDVTDTAPPIVPVAIVTVQPPALMNGERARFEFTSDPPGATFECILDGGEPQPCTSPYEVTVGEGAHTLTIVASWPDGGVDPEPPTFSWTVDLTAPTTTITSAPPAYDNSVEVDFVFSASEAATFECQVDGAAFTACTSPLGVGPLADGAHTVAIRATDLAGNVEATPTSHTWNVDTSTPDTSIDDGPEGDVSLTSATLSFSSPATPPPTFECALDDAAFAACVSPVTYDALDEGEHTFQVRAINIVGALDPTPATRTWVVDTTPPAVILIDGPSGFTAQAAPTFTFHVDGAPVTIECRIDDDEFAVCESPFTPDPLADGDHTFEVRAFDAAGNEDSDVREFIVDTTFPSVAITSGPTGPTNDPTPTFEFTTTSAVDVRCSIDGGEQSICASPFTLPALADGPHTFEVVVENAAGTPASASAAFIVDVVAPTLSLTGGPTGPTNVNPPTFPFDAEAGVTLECKVDAEAFAPCTTPYSPGTLADGPHTVELRATDAAGNVTTRTRSFTIDTTPPTVTITAGPEGATNTNPPTFVFTTSADAATVQCRIDAAAFVNCGPSYTPAALSQGAHTFEVRVADALGNAASVTRAFSIDTVAPTLTITAGPTGPTNTNPPTFSFTAGADASSVQCRVDAGAWGNCTSPFTVAATLADGPHTFEVRASDAVGNTTTASRAFSIDTTAPTLTLTGGPTGPTNVNPPTFTFTAGADATTIECKVDTGGFGTCTSPHTTVVLPQGDRTFEVRVADALGNQRTVSRAFTIDTVAPTITITGGPSGPTNINPPTFSFTAGADAATVQCRIDAAAFANCTSPWTPASVSQGAHTFEVRVADSLGNQDIASRSFEVDTVAPTVTITGGPSAATNTNPPTFTFTASADAASVQCRIDNAAFAACTSPFTPASLGQGNHSFEVRVADALGNATSATRAFAIDTVAPTVTITGGPNGPTATNPPTFTFTAGADASTIECRVDTGAFSACTSPYTTVTLPQGARTFEVRVTDAVGNSNTVSRAFTIDTVAPTIDITAGPNGTTNVNPPTFSFTAGADAATVQCRVDNGVFAACTSPHTTASLSDGAHTFEVRVADSLGNAATASRNFTIDTVAPPVSITGGPKGPTATNPPTFTFTVGAGATTIQCRVDAAAFANCTSPHTTASLAQGNHTFEVRAADSLGNAATASQAFSIDTVAPTISITSGPSGPTATNPPTFAFAAGADATTVECRVDTAAFAACTSPFTTPSLGQGNHTFDVRVADALGNSATASRAFSIDTVAPTLSITAGPNGPTATNPPTFSFTAGADATSIQCRVDAAAFAACTSPHTTASLGQGNHTFEVRVADALGNAATASRAFSVDTVAPTLSITGGPTGPTATNPPTFTFSAGADATSVQCRIDTANFATCTSPYTPGQLGQGNHTFEVRASDALNNTANATRAFAIDTVGPTLTITGGPSGPTNINPPTFTFTVGADAVTVECAVGTGPYATCTSPYTTGQIDQGDYTFYVRAKDTLGNETLATRAFAIDTVPPTVSITGGPTGPTNVNPPAFRFTYSADAATIECRIDQSAFVACTSTWTSPTLGQGNHTFEVRVKDAVGNAASATRSFSIDTEPPTLEILSGPSGPVATNSPSFKFAAGADAVSVQCALDQAAYATCTSPTNYIRLTQGDHTWYLRASDALGNTVTLTRTFTVDTIGPTINITSGPTGPTATNPPTFKFDVSADAVTIQCRIDQAAYVNCSATYTPTALTQGAHTFEVVATDSLGNLSQAVASFTIDTVPPTITITGGPSGPTNVNPPTFSFVAGNDATSVQCRIDNNLYVNCQGTYQPTALTQGAHTFSVRVFDALGNTATATRSFTIDTIAPTVTITEGPADGAIMYEVTSVTYRFSTSGATIIQCRLYSGQVPSAYANCSSPYTKAITYGNYTFQVRALDDAGNSAVTTRTFSNRQLF